MKKKLLLLSAKMFEIQFVLAAQNIGYYVITTGNDPSQPAHKYSDKYIPCDNTNYEMILELVKRESIDAICQGCTDRCALLASYIGEMAGMNGHDAIEVSKIIHHKDRFKEFTNKHNIRSPKTEWFTEKTDALLTSNKYNWPMIIKPVDLGGGQGISVANDENEFRNSVELAFSKSNIGHIVVEPYIAGTVHSMSTFLVNKKVVAYGTANDYSFINSYMTNTGLFPANKSNLTDMTLIKETEKIASILDLVDGLLHFQYIIDKDNNPWIIEMMRRSPGNRFLSALSNSTGVNWIEWIIRAEAGENSYLIPAARQQNGYFGYHSIMTSNNGIFKRIVIDSELRKYVFQIEQFVESGHIVTDFINEKFGSVQFYFPTRQIRDNFLPRINKLVYAFVDDKRNV